MANGPGVGNITADGIQMSSNTMSDDQMREALTVGEEVVTPEPVEPAAEPVVADPAAQPAEPATTDKPKSKSKDAADRIAKATYEREQEKREAIAAKEEARLAREEAAAVRREVEELRRAKAEPEAKRPEAVDTDPEPQFEQFAGTGEKEDPAQYEKWLQAHARWGARQEFKEQRAKEVQQQREFARDRSLHEANQRLGTTVRELMADEGMAEAMQRVMIPGDPTHPVTAAIMQSEVQRELITHLAQHPDELGKILSLPSKLAQYKAMTRIEAQIEFSTAQQTATTAPSGSVPPRQTSKAQPPINPVVGSHVSPKTGPPGDDASQEEFEAYWNRQEREARGRK